MLYIGCSLLAVGLLALDQWSKAWITANLPLGERMDFLPRFLDLQTVHNYGAAWSSFSGQRWLLVVVTCVIVALVVWFLARRIVRHPLGVTAGFLVVAGGLGNIIDRVRLGYVVDMLHFPFWPSYPTFNVADVCVVCGCVLGAVYYLWFYERYDKRDKQHGEHDSSGRG